jgi:cell division protein FtsL
MSLGNKPRGTRGASFKLGFGYLALFLLVLVVVTGSFATHLWVRFEGVRLGYATSKARDERARLLLERRELRLELASLKGPARVEEEAREKLGMEVPEHARIIPMGKTPTSLVASGGAR